MARRATTESGADPGEAEGRAGEEERADILIVDDRPDKILALQSVLDGLGDRIVTASSGKEALRHILRRRFAVVLLDVSMPIMDGFETAELIRQRSSSAHTPIIFVSAINAAETHASRGYSLGAVDYIYTPVVPEVLRAKVSVFIDLFRKNEQVKRQGEQLRASAERRADALEHRLRGLLEQLDVGVFRATPEGRLVEANSAFLGLLGFASPEAAMAADLRPLLPTPDGLGAAGPRVIGWVREPPLGPRAVDSVAATPPGTRWIRLNARASAPVDGGPFLDGIIEDITSRIQTERALMQKAEELAASNAELEQFAYIASHDLQEPLRMVSSYASLVAGRYRAQLDEKAQEYLGYVITGSVRMQGMIKDLLAFSHAGRRDRVLVPVDCGELVRRAMFNLAATIEEAQAEVEAGPLPTIAGDTAICTQLFQNLISNAIKFRDQERPVKVGISAVRYDGGWEFAVADNGIGIAPEYHEKVFGIFQRLHNRSDYPGTGIGLALCRRVVEYMGGRIWVESRPGIGSTFRFRIPDAAASAPATPAPAAASAPEQPAATGLPS